MRCFCIFFFLCTIHNGRYVNHALSFQRRMERKFLDKGQSLEAPCREIPGEVRGSNLRHQIAQTIGSTALYRLSQIPIYMMGGGGGLAESIKRSASQLGDLVPLVRARTSRGFSRHGASWPLSRNFLSMYNTVVPRPTPSSFQGILKMSFLEFQINRFLFSSCFSGNFLLAACILLTGGLFAKMSSFFDLLNLVFISKSTFYVVQSTYILPMIQAAWTRERSRVWELLGKKKLAVAGDGRCDSPGYSAKYGTYTMMDTASQLIIDFELV